MDIEPPNETRAASPAGQLVATADTSGDEFKELLDDLRGLDESCGPSVNKHDRATVLIHACLDHGANTRAHIMALLKPLGFDKRHIAIILKAGTGNDPSRYRWRQLADKTYINFPVEIVDKG